MGETHRHDHRWPNRSVVGGPLLILPGVGEVHIALPAAFVTSRRCWGHLREAREHGW